MFHAKQLFILPKKEPAPGQYPGNANRYPARVHSHRQAISGSRDWRQRLLCRRRMAGNVPKSRN